MLARSGEEPTIADAGTNALFECGQSASLMVRVGNKLSADRVDNRNVKLNLKAAVVSLLASSPDTSSIPLATLPWNVKLASPNERNIRGLITTRLFPLPEAETGYESDVLRQRWTSSRNRNDDL
ncbi:hypothetical protein Trydic_g9282 [Trypoxylus dichotomus]